MQRPGIHEIMRMDLTLMKRAATIIRLVSRDDVVDFRTLMDEMWNIAKQEMDFLIEAGHIEEFSHLNRDNPFISCPRVLRDLSTQYILVMEYIDGIPLDQTDALSMSPRSDGASERTTQSRSSRTASSMVTRTPATFACETAPSSGSISA